MFLESTHKAEKNNSTGLILAASSILSVLTYILVSQLYYRIGFPVGCIWIFQTYARNLAASGVWAFLPGEISGELTSPLWTIMLSVGSPPHPTFCLDIWNGDISSVGNCIFCRG